MLRLKKMRILSLCIGLLLLAIAGYGQQADQPQLRLKVNPTLIAVGEYALIGEYRKPGSKSFELKLGYQAFPSSLLQNIQPPNKGIVVQLGGKQYFARDKQDTDKNGWYGAFVLYKKLSHDRFWFPSKEEITSANTNVAGIKVLKGVELHMKRVLIEPYYGMSMRVKWGNKTVHCSEIPEGEDCPIDGDMNESTSQFGFYPALHLGLRVGLTRPMDK